ncbi:hypothetical protein ABT324_28250 [Saccharopolyspora sp. NPDC000359]|uniref:hypothetical protein n=1 Tax=Saccharopolyspora sp. NPDC000359 TaxID=3154251 RepID=UPI0033299DE3
MAEEYWEEEWEYEEYWEEWEDDDGGDEGGGGFGCALITIALLGGPALLTVISGAWPGMS